MKKWLILLSVTCGAASAQEIQLSMIQRARERALTIGISTELTTPIRQAQQRFYMGATDVPMWPTMQQQTAWQSARMIAYAAPVAYYGVQPQMAALLPPVARQVYDRPLERPEPRMPVVDASALTAEIAALRQEVQALRAELTPTPREAQAATLAMASETGKTAMRLPEGTTATQASTVVAIAKVHADRDRFTRNLDMQEGLSYGAIGLGLFALIAGLWIALRRRE